MPGVALDFSLRIVAAAAAVGLVLLVFRVRSGAARHAAWSAVLLTMLTMPVLTAIVPRIEVPVPSHLALDPGAVAVQIEEPMPDPVIRSAEPASSLTPAAGLIADEQQLTQIPVEPRTTTINWMALALMVYAAGVCVLSARLVVGWRMARRLVRSAARLDLAASAAIFESGALAAPLTTGILRPSIVLPREWRRWSPDTLRAVLAHENAHVQRRDLVVQFLAQVNRAFFWFHPLAWWLERQLAVSSEQACDDSVVRSGGEPYRYAEVLLGIAEAVSHRGQRIAWTAVGMDGSGLLGARIDRVLRGDPSRRMSRTRRVAATLCGAAGVLLAIGCQTETTAPLRPNQEVIERLRLQLERTKQFESARDLSLDRVDALEARIASNPDDWDAREELVIYYTAGTKVPWERKVPGLRRHALWLIEHHPEHEIVPPALSPEYDPVGFAEAVRLWESHLQKPDVSPFLVYRAARFFAPYDKPRAEALIQTGLAMDPASAALKTRMLDNVAGYQWTSQLGMLYAAALLGSVHFASPDFDAERARSPFALTVRQKLAESTDARLLTQVGSYLARRAASEPGAEEVQALGRSYLERAVEIVPELVSARAALVGLRHSERHRRLYDARRNNTPVADGDRLAYLADQAANGVMAADSANYYRNDQTAAAKARQDAAKFAEETLALASGRPEDPTYSSSVATARFVLASEAIRNGDRDGAVAHLMAATQVPPSDDVVYSQAASWLRPVNHLLKAGERERVIAFLEAFARLNLVQRGRLLEDADDIREGRMPAAYQHMLARESAPGVEAR